MANLNQLRRSWRHGAAAMLTALALAFVAPAAMAQEDYPNKPVRIILAFGPGGVSDIVSRLLSEHLEQTFGQRFIVENVPGAGGTVAAQTALSGDNEGYTILNIGNSGAIKKTLMPNLPFDQVEDFDPISPISEFGLVIVATPDGDIQSVADLVSHAKANPNELNIGTVVVGSTQHLSALLFASVAGIEAAIIPFNSSPELMGAVARGEVDVAFEIVAGAKNAIDAGQVRLLATTMDRRSKLYPDVPTVEESGVAPYAVSSWNAYAAPKGIPEEVVAKLNDEIQRILQLPEVQEQMLAYGMEPYLGGPETVRERQEIDTQRWREVILAADVPIEG